MAGTGTGTPATGSTLFSVAEARAFDKAQLTSDTTYPDAAIIAKEAEIREWLERACGVNFITTTHTDEYHDGDGSRELLLDWPRVQAVSAASQRSDTTWTDLTATELGQLQAADLGPVYWDGGHWQRGRRNIKVTYTAGFAAVPALVKQAALAICAEELPGSTTPWQADGYDAGGVSYSIGRGDGYNGQWHSLPIVMRAIRMYDHSLPGVA